MEQEQQGAGPLIGIIIIVLILVLGGIYYAGKTEAPEAEGPSAADILDESDPLSEELQDVGTSDEIADIESDLLDTNLQNIDAELGDIEAELQNL